jgi:hypothetical protein
LNAKALDIAMYFRAQITSSLLKNIPQALLIKTDEKIVDKWLDGRRN